MAFALILSLTVVLMAALSSDRLTGFILRYVVTLALMLCLLGGFLGTLFGALSSKIIEAKSVPNLGIRLSIRNAMYATGVGATTTTWLTYVLGSWLVAEVLLGMPTSVGNGMKEGLMPGSIVGLISGCWYGGLDVIQHYTLRFILYWKGYTTLRYASFLDYAARLVFLQKVGGGYIFIHRLLLEHFAAMRQDEKETAPTRQGLSAVT